MMWESAEIIGLEIIVFDIRLALPVSGHQAYVCSRESHRRKAYAGAQISSRCSMRVRQPPMARLSKLLEPRMRTRKRPSCCVSPHVGGTYGKQPGLAWGQRAGLLGGR